MNPSISKFEITEGKYAGLLIAMIEDIRLKGMTAVKVTHSKIEGFEARALVPSGTTVSEVYKEVVKEVRLAA